MSHLWLLALGWALWSSQLQLAESQKGKGQKTQQKPKIVGPPPPLPPLPLNVKPDRYNLTITTMMEKGGFKESYEGEVRIDVHVERDTRTITVNEKGIDVQSKIWLIRKISDRRISVNHTDSDLEKEQLTIHFNNWLWLGERYTLVLFFRGWLNQTNRGYYKIGYQDEKKKHRWLTATNFEPNMARLAFPCFDDPKFKTPFLINMAHPKTFVAISNMPEIKQIEHGSIKDYWWTYFNESMPISTSMVSFSLNLFESKDAGRDEPPLKIRTWVRADVRDCSSYAVDIAPQLIDYYEGIFKLRYPLTKLDQLALPDGPLGTPNSLGLIAYKESSLLYDKKSSPLQIKRNIAARIAEQLARQWFGNLVSASYSKEVWFQEGLALYISGFAVDKVEPTWRYHENQLLLLVSQAFEEDLQSHQRPLISDMTEPFDSILRSKSAVLFHMFHHVVGTNVFLVTLRSFLQEHPFGPGNPDRLFTLMQNESTQEVAIRRDINLTELRDSWTLQEGYPLITVKRDYDTHMAHVSQQRFSRSSKSAKSYCWLVPLTYTSKSEPDFAHTMPNDWLKCSSSNNSLSIKEIAKPRDWVIFNLRLTSPYRVNYDTKNWKLLKAALKKETFQEIDVMNRAQLIDDALSLSWNGLLPYNISLPLVKYLKHETEVIVWEAAIRSFEKLKNVLKQTPSYRLFEIFMRKLVESKFKELYGEKSRRRRTATETTPLMAIIQKMSCEYNLGPCVERANHQYSEVTEEKNNIPVEERETTYCTAIKHGTEGDWTLLRTLYDKSSVSEEKMIIMMALGCSRDNWAMEKILRMTFTPKNSNRLNAERSFRSIVKNPVGFNIARTYLTENFAEIKNFFANSTQQIAELFRPILEEVSSEKALNYLRNFVKDKLKDLPGLDVATKDYMERATDNIYWRNNYYAEVGKAFDAYF